MTVQTAGVSADRTATVLRALGDPARLRIIWRLREEASGELRVGELVAAFDLSQPTISHHLKVLFDAGLLQRRQEGNSVLYRVDRAAFDELVGLVRGSGGDPTSGQAPAEHRTEVSAAAGPARATPGRRPARSGPAATDRYLTRTAEDLGYRFAGVFSRETVERYVRESYQALYLTAKSRAHLPLLTSRFAGERLAALAQATGRAAKPVPEVLFVCTQNSGRSQLAAAILTRISGGRVHVRSAGSRPGSAVDPVVVAALAELGLAVGAEFPKPLTDDVIRAADVVVTMGCGDTCPLYPGKRYLDWDLPDPAGLPLAEVRKIRDLVGIRVRNLLTQLGIDNKESND